MTKPLIFNEAAPDYPGVIAAGAKLRLIVSPRGATYRLQERHDREWRLLRAFPSAAPVQVWCAVVGIDVPPAVLAAVVGLPDDPADCLHVPVPTAPQDALGAS